MKKEKNNHSVVSLAEEQGPNEAVRSLSWEVFKTCLDVARS